MAVNSARRAAQVEALVTAAANDLLCPPLITIRTVAQMQEDHRNAAPSEAVRSAAGREMMVEWLKTLETAARRIVKA